jgi:UDP-N-acetylmuramyl pentapeptide phosphotransferase/UDP-N-acetylglucosamine-1-phosphate transferase
MSWSFHAVLGIAAAIVTVLATGLVLRQLRARAVLDLPNERSSHDRAVPRGGGIAVIAVVAGGWALLAWQRDGWRGDSFDLLAVAILAAALAGISFLDDLRGMPALQRLLWQILAVALGCLVLPETPVFQGVLPPLADRLAAGFCWLWFINLFNFMDGIDGITVVEAGTIGLGITLVTAVMGGAGGVGGAGGLGAPAIIVAGAAIGFGFWNWHPAKIFLGDVGSVGLGLLLGWLLLSLAAVGQWLPALLLPLYYLTDATWTLLRRMFRGEKFWRAHRSHFYQHAARRCGNHAKVSLRVLCANLVLIAAALWAALHKDNGLAPVLAAALGAMAVAILLYSFVTMKKQANRLDEANQS